MVFFITVIKCQNIKNLVLPVAESKNIFFKCSIPKFILRWSKNFNLLFELSKKNFYHIKIKFKNIDFSLAKTTQNVVFIVQ